MKVLKVLNRVLFILVLTVNAYWYFDFLKCLKEGNLLAILGSLLYLVFSTIVSYDSFCRVLSDLKTEIKEEMKIVGTKDESQE